MGHGFTTLTPNTIINRQRLLDESGDCTLTKMETTRFSATVWCAASFGTRQFVRQIWLELFFSPVQWLNCHLVCITGHWLTAGLRHAVVFMLLSLRAARNNRTKVFKHQVFKHTTVPRTNQSTCTVSTRCPVSVDRRYSCSSGTDLGSFLPPFFFLKLIQKGRSDPPSAPVRRTTYLPRVWQYVACT